MQLKKIIEIENLGVHSKQLDISLLNAVYLTLYENEIVSLLGESGSGKSTLAYALMDLLPESLRVSGTIRFRDEGKNWVRGKNKAMIFQDPQVSLHPYYTLEFQMQEVLKTHLKMPKSEYLSFLISRLKEVGLNGTEEILKSYPHQLSGGEKQRALIAMALLCDPEFLIADEPTASLDFVVKVQILKLLLELKKKRNFSLLMITHDLDVALKVSDRLVLMREGEVIEEGSPQNFSKKAQHLYSQNLFVVSSARWV